MHLATVNISDSLQCSAIKLNFLYKKKIKRMGGNTSSPKNKTSKNITFNKFLAKHIDGYSPVGLPVRSNQLTSVPCLGCLPHASANSFLFEHQLFPPHHFPLVALIPLQAHLPPQPTFLSTSPFFVFF